MRCIVILFFKLFLRIFRVALMILFLFIVTRLWMRWCRSRRRRNWWWFLFTLVFRLESIFLFKSILFRLLKSILNSMMFLIFLCNGLLLNSDFPLTWLVLLKLLLFFFFSLYLFLITIIIINIFNDIVILHYLLFLFAILFPYQAINLLFLLKSILISWYPIFIFRLVVLSPWHVIVLRWYQIILFSIFGLITLIIIILYIYILIIIIIVSIFIQRFNLRLILNTILILFNLLSFMLFLLYT